MHRSDAQVYRFGHVIIALVGRKFAGLAVVGWERDDYDTIHIALATPPKPQTIYRRTLNDGLTRQQRYAAKRKAEGKCRSGDGNPVVPARTLCMACIAKQKLRSDRHYRELKDED